MPYGRRTFSTNGKGLVLLLQAISSDSDVRVVNDAIPPGAALCGEPRINGERIEVDIVSHNWPDDIDPNSPLHLMYARRFGHSGTHGDWSAPISVGGA